MKHLFRLSAIVAAAAALAINPADAQTRNRNNSNSSDKSSQKVEQSNRQNPRRRQSAAAQQKSNSSQQAKPSQPQTKPQARPQQPQRTRPQQPQTRPQQPQTRPQQSHPGNNSQAQPNRRPQQPQTRPQQPQTRPQQPQARPDRGQHRPPQDARPQRPPQRPQQPRVEPRHRPPVAYDAPGRFYDVHKVHHYGNRIHRLPPRYRIIHHCGVPYYICDGIYYRRHGSYYYVCRPPFGVHFDHIVSDIALSACAIAFYFDRLNEYQAISENARIIISQNEAIAANNATLAAQNEMIAKNEARAAGNNRLADESYALASRMGLVQSYASASTEYFYDDGVFYVKTSDGQYQTIAPPAGALVNELPDDYEVFTFDNDEYYLVDDSVYRTVVIEGKVYFEVLGQRNGGQNNISI